MMQVFLDDDRLTYYGDLDASIRKGSRFLEIPVVVSDHSVASGSFLSYQSSPVITMLRLEIDYLKRRIALPEHLMRDEQMAQKYIEKEMHKCHAPSDAKVAQNYNIMHKEYIYTIEWPVLKCPISIAEQVFELDRFTPA